MRVQFLLMTSIALLRFRFVGDFYTPLEPYFVADPLLLYDFVYLCPEDDYQVLFGKVPSHISLTWLTSYRPLPLLQYHVRNSPFHKVLLKRWDYAFYVYSHCEQQCVVCRRTYAECIRCLEKDLGTLQMLVGIFWAYCDVP